MIKKKYDRHYHENFAYREVENSQRNQQRLNLLMGYKRAGNLLEIGCGKAGFLQLAEKHFKVEGMDISEYAIETIKHHFGSRVRVGNVEQNALPHNRYDVVAVFNILEHLRQPRLVVDRLYSSLMQDGLVIGSVPNNYSLIGSLVTWLGNFVDRTHVSTFEPERWKRIFQQAGFRKIHFFGEVTLGRNRCHYLRGNLWPHLSFNLMFICIK